MAWIESHDTLGEHPKIYELCTSLNVVKATAIGVLHLLWHFTLKFAWRDGDLSRYSKESICHAIGWKDDANTLFESLHKCGWLDDMRVHDWNDYAGKIVIDRLYNEKRKRRKTAKNGVSLRKSTATQPNLTIPNLTIPKEEGESKTAPTTQIVEPTKNGTSQNGHGPTPSDLIALWNKLAHPNLPRVEMLTDVRKTRIKRRLADYPEKKFWDSLMVKVNSSKMLTGENNRGWKCSFDWIINENNMAKILEGNYDDNGKTAFSARSRY